MNRKVFFSFHFKADCWRASQVRNIGVVEGNTPVSDNDWETIKRGGDAAVKSWIGKQLKGKSCTVVLVGANTARRRWVRYEIAQSWRLGKGVVGVRVHGLRDRNGNTSSSGPNPFEFVSVDGRKLSSIVKLHNPWSIFSSPYEVIKSDIARWVEEAIALRESTG